jgi:SAM-dependent methyltransferase
MLDYGIFLWEDQIKRFSRSRLLCNLRYRLRGAPDGLPIPPAYLIWLVVGTSNIQAFLDSGRIHAYELLEPLLGCNQLRLRDFGTVLDFGCGCGRILRHWNSLDGPVFYGSDYNRVLVEWSRRHLPHSRFTTNQLAPPTSFNDEMFDFAYARSVFTHLSLDLQHAWMQELYRIVQPGGYLIITVSGDQFRERMTPSELGQYEAGELVVRAGELEGSNYCAVYHPPSYVQQQLVRDWFDIVEMMPGDKAKEYCEQDTYLLRRSQ